VATLLQDFRYALRTLRHDAGFTTFAILIVGLGIAASSTVFSVANALMIRPLPFRDPNRLVWIANHDESGLSGQTTQVGHLLDLRERNQSFSDLAAYFAFYGVGDSKLTGTGEPERLSGVPVSENFFPLLGVQPQLGRLFTAEECKWNGPKAVLLSHGLWERRFASDPGIVGSSLTLDDQPVTVAEVLPDSFDFASVFAPGSHIDLYFPFPLSAETNRWGNTMAIIGRLKPGVTAARAQAELRILAEQITRAHPERNDFEGKISLHCAIGEYVLPGHGLPVHENFHRHLAGAWNAGMLDVPMKGATGLLGGNRVEIGSDASADVNGLGPVQLQLASNVGAVHLEIHQMALPVRHVAVSFPHILQQAAKSMPPSSFA